MGSTGTGQRWNGWAAPVSSGPTRAPQRCTISPCFGLWYDAQIGHLRALESVRSAGIEPEDFAPLAATQLGHVERGAIGTAREYATRSYPRGPADLTEHAPVLDRLVALRRGQRLGDGDLGRVLALIRRRIELGHGHEGLTSIVD